MTEENTQVEPVVTEPIAEVTPSSENVPAESAVVEDSYKNNPELAEFLKADVKEESKPTEITKEAEKPEWLLEKFKSSEDCAFIDFNH